jgi:hypothetical protein
MYMIDCKGAVPTMAGVRGTATEQTQIHVLDHAGRLSSSAPWTASARSIYSEWGHRSATLKNLI